MTTITKLYIINKIYDTSLLEYNLTNVFPCKFLQANVAFKRIQAYLEKDEIKFDAVTKHTDSSKYFELLKPLLYFKTIIKIQKY